MNIYWDEINSSLSGKVFKQLEEEILNGKYKPGDSLIETKISTNFGVSRTPVREAIKQLELEGLVRTIPNKGAVVLGISKKDIKDIYIIRMLIEGLAARWAAENITDIELEKLKESIELSEFYTNKNDTNHIQVLDSRFHEIIYTACKSKPLRHILTMFHHYTKRARATSFAVPGRAIKALEEHKAILKSIVEKNPDKAELLTYKHIENASKNLTLENKG